MPIYEYRCDECKKNFEVLATSSSDTKEVKCNCCGSAKVRKTISAGSYKISSGKSSIPAGALSGCSSGSGFS